MILVLIVGSLSVIIVVFFRSVACLVCKKTKEKTLPHRLPLVILYLVYNLLMLNVQIYYIIPK